MRGLRECDMRIIIFFIYLFLAGSIAGNYRFLKSVLSVHMAFLIKKVNLFAIIKMTRGTRIYGSIFFEIDSLGLFTFNFYCGKNLNVGVGVPRRGYPYFKTNLRPTANQQLRSF